ncbi:MAG: ABC transporter permease [Longimicrobiales bacterium]
MRRPRPHESATWEVEHHLTELTDRLVAEGWEPDQARVEAERRFGDRARYQQRMRRAEWGLVVVDRWAARAELTRRSAIAVGRLLRRQPHWAAGIILTLAIGIGANATMYGIIDRLLLRPPAHIVDPGRVVRVHGQVRGISGEMFRNPLTYPDYVHLRAHSGFEAIAAYSRPGPRTVRIGESAERLQAAEAAGELFPLLGVSPAFGRFYTPEEAQPGSEPTVVLGHEYWRSRFTADPEILGQTLEINGRDHTIIGVAPAGLTGVDLARVDAWLPFELTATADRGNLEDSWNCYCVSAVARLTDGVSTDAAYVEGLAIVTNAREAAGASMTNIHGITFTPLILARGPEAGSEARVAQWLTGVSLIVLLIACANVANLLTARSLRRRKEIGVRLALGAGRRALVVQAVIESLLLACIGGAFALLIAEWGGSVVRSTLLPDVFFPESALSPRLALITALLAVGAGLLAGVAPAIQSSRADVVLGLKQDGAALTPRSSRLRGFLTVLQASLTVVLLVGAGLFIRSVAEVRRADLGLDVDRLVAVQLELDETVLQGVVADLDGAAAAPGAIRAAHLMGLYEEAIRRIDGLPGVISAAATGSGLGSGYSTTLRADGVDSIPRLAGGGPYQSNVSSNYFETIGLGVSQGRGVLPSDVDGAERATVVSDLMARTIWPDGDAVGRCIYVGRGATECTRVVGVVEDAARNGLRDAPHMAYYLPGGQAGRPYNTVYVRAQESADDIVPRVAAALRSLAPEVRYVRVETMRDRLDPQARSWTLGAAMFTIFGLLALVVAAVGLYSVLAFDVAQRTRELGIRTALGARKARLLRSVLWQGISLTGLGVALGLAAVYWAAPYAQDLLFDTSPRDPWVLGGVAGILLVVSMLAGLVPGLRATRVDPMRALKAD